MKSSNEFLINNYVEKEMRQVLRPLELLEKICFASRYTIKYNFVTSNTGFYKIASFLFSVFWLVCDIVFKSYLELNTHNLSKHGKVLNIQILSIFLMEYILKFYYGVIKSDKFVQIILDMQCIDRTLGLKHEKRLHKSKRLVYKLMTVLYLYQIWNIVITFQLYKNLSWGNVILVLTIPTKMLFDLTTVYVALIVDFLKSRLDVLGAEMEHPNIGDGITTDINIPTNSDSYETFCKILKVFKLVEEIFGVSIFLMIFETLMVSLIYVQVELMIFSHSVSDQGVAVSMANYLIWMTKMVLPIVTMCVKCQDFHTSIRNIIRICLRRLKTMDNNESSKSYKNIIRKSHVSYSKMRACGLFAVDADLPLSMFGLVVTYTVVILQFAFMSQK